MPSKQPEDPHEEGTISEADRAAIKRRSTELGERLDRLRTANAPRPRPASGRSDAGALAEALKMAIEPAVGIIVGIFLGLTADNAMGTAPLFLIIGLFVGGAAGMLNLFRAASRATGSTTTDPQANAGEDPKDGSPPDRNRGE